MEAYTLWKLSVNHDFGKKVRGWIENDLRDIVHNIHNCKRWRHAIHGEDLDG